MIYVGKPTIIKVLTMRAIGVSDISAQLIEKSFNGIYLNKLLTIFSSVQWRKPSVNDYKMIQILGSS